MYWHTTTLALLSFIVSHQQDLPDVWGLGYLGRGVVLGGEDSLL